MGLKKNNVIQIFMTQYQYRSWEFLFASIRNHKLKLRLWPDECIDDHDEHIDDYEDDDGGGEETMTTTTRKLRRRTEVEVKKKKKMIMRVKKS